MSDDGRHESTLRKWEREEERKKARAEASEANFVKTFADELRKQSVKKALAAEAQTATKNPGARTELMQAASEGTSRAMDDDEVVTGMEDRPWEN
jgi:hypothetical protein